MSFTTDDQNNVEIALTTFADLGDEFMKELRSTEPPLGSRVHDWFSAPTTADHTVSAFHAIEMAILSGGDHLRSLHLLSQVATSSAVTVARGAVEAYATASHLSTAPTAAEFTKRHLLALRKEYRYLVKNSASLTNLEGATLNPTQEQQRVEADLQMLGVPSQDPVGMTGKVKDILDRAAASSGGDHVYSGLSSVAHAQLTGLGAFVSSDTAGMLGLELNRDTFVNLVFMASASAGQALDDVVLLFGDQPAHRFVLNSALGIVSDARSALVLP